MIGQFIETSGYLVEYSSFPDHMSSSFLPDVLDSAANDVASRLRQDFGGRAEAALMLPLCKTIQSMLPALKKLHTRANIQAG